MTWTPRAEWINVKSCSALTGGANAAGNGTTDDTAAIQAVFNYLQAHSNGNIKTVYFPAGTYKITSTLTLTGGSIGGIRMIGCGSSTIISWAGASGGAMFRPSGTYSMRYNGFVWEGNNIASCAYEEASQSYYETDIRHDNESFRNFTVPGTYSYYNTSGTLVTTPAGLPAGIICGFPPVTNGGVTGEFMIYNCRFYNCTYGVVSAWQETNNYMWDIDHCEFDNCGTGFLGGGGYCYTLTNCHFDHSTNQDIWGGGSMHIRRCTSEGSKTFVYRGFGGCVIADCWVDSWTGVNGAISFATVGPNSVYDCTFTNPPAGSYQPVEMIQYYLSTMSLLLSNNYAPDFPGATGLVNYGAVPSVIAQVPSGVRGSTLTSPMQTFLKTDNFTETTHILDVTLSPYTADKTGVTDSTTTIQAAITAAQTANNGTIVYIPGGIYKVSSTLTLSGGNYSVQGAGYITELCWYGGSNGTMMTVTSPQNINVTQLRLAVLYNKPSDPPNYSASYPTTDPVTVKGIYETATGTSNVVYDDVYYNAFPCGNWGVGWDNSDGPGIVLNNLPAGSKVTMPHPLAPLTVQNCGAAQIFANFMQIGVVTVSGTGAKTGFLGANIGEGGQSSIPSAYNILVTDNQDFVMGSYYSEQTSNIINVQRGSGTGTGKVTIEGFLSATTGPTTAININNYAGRFFYGMGEFINNNGNSLVQITHTGTNALDLVLAANNYFGGAPNLTYGAGATPIETVNTYNDSSYNSYTITDTPNPLTAANLSSVTQSLDHLRQLGAMDLMINNGISQLMANTSAELDAVNPTPTTAIGYNPASWTVSNSLATGGGARNLTVVPGGSPFAAGAKSMLWVDTTASATGSTLNVNQTVAASPANYGAVQTIDFRCNGSATYNDLWVVVYGSWGHASGIHITSNGLSGRISAGVGGGDTYLGPFTLGVWYRAQVVLAPPNAGKSNATLFLTPWSGNGPGATTAYTIDGIPATETSGFTGISLTTGGAPGASQNMNIDNLGLSINGTLFTPPNRGVATGLAGYWKLDETTGTTSIDSSGNSITGTWQGSPTFSATKPSPISFTDPGCLSFSGISQSVNLGKPLSLPYGRAARTICGWAKANSTVGGYREIASYGTPGTSQAMFIGMNGTTLVGGGYGDDLSVASFWDGNWHFIALTYDGTTAKLYADGTLLTSSAKTWNLVPNIAYIGEQVNNSEYWNGLIDDVRIYDRALSSTEISNLAAGNP